MNALPIVVAAACLRPASGPFREVLGACRSAPPRFAGRWELPGGKVEPGESEPEALARECREELGVQIRVDGRIGADVALATGAVLRAYLAEIVTGEPQALEHRELRWLGADDLGTVDWLDHDRPILEALEPVLAGRAA